MGFFAYEEVVQEFGGVHGGPQGTLALHTLCATFRLTSPPKSPKHMTHPLLYRSQATWPSCYIYLAYWGQAKWSVAAW